jgi:ABC-type enterobactin transport system permease subunit
MVWSFRVVKAGAISAVSLSPPHAARRLEKHTQKVVHRMTSLMSKSLSLLKDTPYPIIPPGTKSLAEYDSSSQE